VIEYNVGQQVHQAMKGIQLDTMMDKKVGRDRRIENVVQHRARQ
jgi:hypothetical protein